MSTELIIAAKTTEQAAKVLEQIKSDAYASCFNSGKRPDDNSECDCPVCRAYNTERVQAKLNIERLNAAQVITKLADLDESVRVSNSAKERQAKEFTRLTQELAAAHKDLSGAKAAQEAFERRIEAYKSAEQRAEQDRGAFTKQYVALQKRNAELERLQEHVKSFLSGVTFEGK